jgi:hypothetical protein
MLEQRARIGRSGGHIVGATTTAAGSQPRRLPAADHGRTAASIEEAEPQQRRRPNPRFLDLSLCSHFAGAVRQLDGTGANGPRRPPTGAGRLRHQVGAVPPARCSRWEAPLQPAKPVGELKPRRWVLPCRQW